MDIREDKYFIFDSPHRIDFKAKVRLAIRKVKNDIYKLYMNCNPVKERENVKYNVSICAIFKNEAAYLKEWLEFNHIVGIEHFYMYNNNSEDNFREVLDPYIKSGMVTLVEWPHNQQQMQAYKDCIKNYAHETKWMGFIDIDEFIVPKSTDNIYDFLKPFEKNRGAVSIYWRLYGTSGFQQRDIKGLVVEDFTVCWPKYCDIGKCFYNTSYGFDELTEKNVVLHHWFWPNIGGRNVPPVNVFDYVSMEGYNDAKSEEFPIQINHYFTKSYEEYAIKRSKGDVYFITNPHDEEYFFEHEMKCTSVDYSAYKYLIKLKLAMQKESK